MQLEVSQCNYPFDLILLIKKQKTEALIKKLTKFVVLSQSLLIVMIYVHGFNTEPSMASPRVPPTGCLIKDLKYYPFFVHVIRSTWQEWIPGDGWIICIIFLIIVCTDFTLQVRNYSFWIFEYPFSELNN